MDIVLNTHTRDPSLALRAVRKFRDGSGYSSRLIVISDVFKANKPFCFEEYPLKGFVTQLAEMNDSLRGETIPKPPFEEDCIAFRMLSFGHVLVHGELFDYSEETQRLRFAFRTAQTGLKPFVADLRALHEATRK